MQLTYKYRLKPTKHQKITIATHLELCRRQYNYRLGERFKWLESTRTPINAFPLTAYRVSEEEIYKNIPLTTVQTRDGRKKDGTGNPYQFFHTLDDFSFKSKELYNLCNYYMRQNFFDKGRHFYDHLTLKELYAIPKPTEAYHALPAKLSNQVIK